jgi:hypothetical protein
MSLERDSMITVLKRDVIPVLKELGFKGTFPHFRRINENKIDLLTFQFDRYGGGFLIEVATCPSEGVFLHWGEKVPPNKVTAHDLHPDNRLRLKGNKGVWFRYDVKILMGNIYEKVAKKVLDQINQAEIYWQNESI